MEQWPNQNMPNFQMPPQNQGIMPERYDYNVPWEQGQPLMRDKYEEGFYGVNPNSNVNINPNFNTYYPTKNMIDINQRDIYSQRPPMNGQTNMEQNFHQLQQINLQQSKINNIPNDNMIGFN